MISQIETNGIVVNGKPLSKRQRFEIFKRDGFTCQYCGRRPPDTVLEVDHIDPRANGGSNDAMNLIASCYDCNRGKGKRLLGHVAVRPDADIEFLNAQQEIAEARRFLVAKSELDVLKNDIVNALQAHWDSLLRMEDHAVPADQVILGWLSHYSPEEVVTAIDVFGRSYQRNPCKFARVDRCITYMGGILRNKRDGL